MLEGETAIVSWRKNGHPASSIIAVEQDISPNFLVKMHNRKPQGNTASLLTIAWHGLNHWHMLPALWGSRTMHLLCILLYSVWFVLFIFYVAALANINKLYFCLKIISHKIQSILEFNPNSWRKINGMERKKNHTISTLRGLVKMNGPVYSWLEECHLNLNDHGINDWNW